ncbi:MAG TPA: hypothetical protein VF733_01760 [Candidatus Saccharimonadales bacterium]
MSREVANDNRLAREAAIFCRYLIGRKPVPKVAELYVHALRTKPGKVTRTDDKLLKFIRRCPWSAGFIDAGLSVINTDSEVRRRIYVTFSIIEAMPEYADRFLPKKRCFWYLFVLLFAGLRGVLRTFVGVILVKVVA